MFGDIATLLAAVAAGIALLTTPAVSTSFTATGEHVFSRRSPWQLAGLIVAALAAGLAIVAIFQS